MSNSGRKKVVIIAGTPGTGKTTVSQLLAERLGGIHIDLSRYATMEKLVTGYDEEHLSYIIDEEKLVKNILNYIDNVRSEIFILDTHYPEIFPKDIVDYVFVLRAHPFVLEERLKKKGWPWRKIRENIMAEILSVVLVNSIESFGEEKVFEVDTSNKSPVEVAKHIEAIIKGYIKPSKQRIDWLSLLDPEIIEKYET